MTDVWETLSRPEPQRDRYGRPLILPEGGDKHVPYTRPTTIADTLDDRHNLELWMQRQVALGLVARPDLVARIATTDPTDKSTLNGICTDARDAAGSSAAANLGTAIHAAIETVNRGGDAPDMFAEHVDRYRQTLAAHHITVDPDHVEQFCVNEPVKAAGTFDMIVTVDGRNYIADLKTGSSVAWSGRSFAVQLAIYAGATSYYDTATNTHHPVVDVDQDTALIVHLPAAGGDCTLHWLDISAGREALQHALWVRQWRRRDDLLVELPLPELAAVPDPAPGEDKPKARRKSSGKPKPRRTLEPVPMPPLPESTPEPAAKPRPTPTPRHDPAEGDLVAADVVAELRDRALASDGEPTIRRWVDESRAADADFSMGRGMHTTRRYLISCAAVNLADTDDEWARAVLAVVVGDNAHDPTVTVGALLGRLTIDEATRVDSIARTGTAFYTDDGTLVVQEAS